MANIGKWNTPATIATVLSSDLNSAANGSFTTQSVATPYDNATLLNLYINVEIFLASLSPTSGAYVALYYLPTLDGTNYGDANQAYTTQLIAQSAVDTTAASTKRIIISNILLPPAKGKFALYQATGVSLNASGNTVKIIACNINLNGS